MKKIIAMVLALVMVLAIGVVAFADELAKVRIGDPKDYPDGIRIGQSGQTIDRAPGFGRYYYGFGFLDDDDPVEFYIPAENPDTGAPVMIGSYVAGAVVLVAAAAYVAKHK